MSVEVTGWRTSSYSANGGGNCVEVGVVADGGGVAVRHSRNPGGSMILVADAAWAAFVSAVRAGSFRC